ncbi:MFS family permease [Arthrobacter ginsengisoli]|uniref:MFS family permease n=1 Tax=Arthrobacter ginsengisoli TaxID=1356565 RepID=A0ABU1UDU4_9MICC|nr:MFS transporter [Arthrobacter ginsengisoli]MDR7083359.1 MFS family permease [Arthrobacter ginsengisoli]
MASTQQPGFGNKQQKRAFLASLVGTTVEWFDFFIYATAASLVFSTIFFPDFGPNTGLLASFATLGVAFLARPVGAFIFGHLGDRLGRRTTLIATLTMMGLATGLIGVLPTWAEIGIWAPILLTFLRFIQGVAVGGEWSGAVLMSVENAPKARARFYGAAPQIASPLALVLATVVMYFVAKLPSDQLLAWGWRIPFLAGFVLVIIGMIIRVGVQESQEFQELKEASAVKTNPIATVIKRMPARVLVGIGLQASVIVLFYLITTYMLSMATQRHGLERSDTLMILLIAASVDLVAIVVVGILADKINPWKIFMVGVAFTLLFAVPLFFLFDTGNAVLMTLAFTFALVLGHASVYAVVSSMTFDLFPTEVRYSGVALCSAFAGVAWAASTPLLAAVLVPTKGTAHWWPLAGMIILASVVSLLCGLAARKYKKDVDDEPQPSAVVPAQSQVTVQNIG